MPFFVWETNGPQGPSGLSAYQIAQANGFGGTELEWLAFLQGEQGIPGNAGMFELEFPEPEDTWVIQHSLGFRPNVNVVDANGEVIYCQVTHVNKNLAVLTFSQPFAGIATFS
jgi:hypothetical protein